MIDKLKYFIFLLFFLLFNQSIKAQDELSCKDFKEGTFVIPAKDGMPETLIIRKGNQQTEIMELKGVRHEDVIDLKWIDDCTYLVALKEEINSAGTKSPEALAKMIITIQMTSIEGSCANFMAEGDGIGQGIVVMGKICIDENL